MDADERLANLFKRGGINFSIETMDNAKVLITITRSNGSTSDTVGGTYDSVDEGINHCIDNLEAMNRKRIGLKVVK